MEILAALADRRAWDVLVVPMRSGDAETPRLPRGAGPAEPVGPVPREGSAVAGDARRAGRPPRWTTCGLVETLRHEAYHDAGDRPAEPARDPVVAQARGRRCRCGGVLLVELDVLPEVNNAIGSRPRGARLAPARERLVEIGEEQTVARIEVDRFAVLGAEPECRKRWRAAGGPGNGERAYSLDGIGVEPAAGAGSRSCPEAARVRSTAGSAPARTRTALLQRAEMALIAAQTTAGRLRTYRPSMGEVFPQRFPLVTQCGKAVEDGLDHRPYQPKLDLAGARAGRRRSAGALATPGVDLVPPAEFVQAIEATGSIDTLLPHVMEVVLAPGVRLDGPGHAHRRRRKPVGTEPARPPLPGDWWRNALSRHGVPAELLTFEITVSSVIADPERSLPILRRAAAPGDQALGRRFGTGYSSLAYLRRLPVDEIKIDRLRPGHGHRPV